MRGIWNIYDFPSAKVSLFVKLSKFISEIRKWKEGRKSGNRVRDAISKEKM